MTSDDGMGRAAAARSLRVVAGLLRAVTAVLVVVTAIAVPALGWWATGRTSMGIGVTAQLAAPYTVRLADDRAVEMAAPNHAAVYLEVEPGQERRYLSAFTVTTHATVGRDDRDTRVVIAAAAGVALAIAWTFLVTLRQLVRAELGGGSDDARTVTRVRRLAALVFVLPFFVQVVPRVLDHTLDVDPAVHVAGPGPQWWVLLGAAIALYVVAEMIRSHRVEQPAPRPA
jgi:hypothetical protein